MYSMYIIFLNHRIMNVWTGAILWCHVLLRLRVRRLSRQGVGTQQRAVVWPWSWRRVRDSVSLLWAFGQICKNFSVDKYFCTFYIFLKEGLWICYWWFSVKIVTFLVCASVFAQYMNFWKMCYLCFPSCCLYYDAVLKCTFKFFFR